ncbi:hypothetical protein M3Y97_00766500 [Aphelenchoides bicaudatus]|nr:hypothetical protein M3Y97_00766500 [Aphelenchoides bicaudatus]
MDLYHSLDRRRLPRHMGHHQKQRAPTALELLEASKKLYVQTEFLKSHKIDPNKPRLFRTDSEEELDQLYQNSLRLPVELQPSNFAHPSPPKFRDQTNGTLLYLSKPTSQQTHLSSAMQQTRKSAFHPVQKTPPRPSKSDALKKRQFELASSTQSPYADVYYTQPRPAPSKIMTQSLPSYEEFMKQEMENAKQKENRPVPPPRRSLLKTQKAPPVAMPRRRQTTNYFGDIPSLMTQSTYINDTSERMRSQATSTTNLLAKSTPDLSLEFLLNSNVNSTLIPATSKHSTTSSIQTGSTHFSSNGTTPELPAKSSEVPTRPQRSNSQLSAESSKPPRPPTKPTRVKRSTSNTVSRQSSSSFPSPDSSSTKDSGILCNTPEMTSMQITSSDADFEERVQRWERRKTVALTPSAFLQPINEKVSEPRAEATNSKSAVQELFDSQGIDPRLLNEIHASSSEAHEDSDMVSDFTSITAERKHIEEQADDERECTPKAGLPLVSEPEKPVSQFERNAKVLRWIYNCSMATSTNC